MDDKPFGMPGEAATPEPAPAAPVAPPPAAKPAPKKKAKKKKAATKAKPKGVVPSLFRINVEPSGTVHSRFPVGAADGCVEGANSIGYTVAAD